MDEGQGKKNNLVETTDCLEAVGVFRGWKNFLFLIVILSLILLQASFWLVNTGYIKADDGAKSGRPVVAGEKEKFKEALKRIAGDPNKVDEEQRKSGFLFDIKFKHLTWLIRFVNFVVIPAAVLYCLTMLFILKVSLLGRLGGINHICRAFFLSLVMVVLLLPWQLVFGGVVAGVIYTPDELLSSCAAERGGMFEVILFYLRFTGYLVLVVLLLIFSQVRSCRWAKATLRRLEVI